MEKRLDKNVGHIESKPNRHLLVVKVIEDLSRGLAMNKGETVGWGRGKDEGVVLEARGLQWGWGGRFWSHLLRIFCHPHHQVLQH